MKKTLACLSLMLLIAVTVAGCASPAPATPSPKPPAPTVTPTPTPTAKPSPTAAPAKLPAVITVTAHPAQMGQGARSVALSRAIEKFSPMKVRVEPGTTDVAMIGPVALGEAELLEHTGATAYSAVMGEFKELGRVQLWRVWNGNPFAQAMATLGDTPYKKISDLKGKKIPQTPASVGWSQNIESYLAFGGLTLKDVQVVTAPGITQGQKALLEGAVDATAGAPFGATFVEIASGRRGIHWFQMPKEDVEGWKRLQAVRPVNNPVALEKVPGMKEGEILWAAGYEEAFWSTPKVSEDIIYAVAKALKEGYDSYKDIDPELKKWTWKRAYALDGLIGIVPYHPGTVKFFKDMGVWSAEHEKFQQEALRLEKQRLGK